MKYLPVYSPPPYLGHPEWSRQKDLHFALSSIISTPSSHSSASPMYSLTLSFHLVFCLPRLLHSLYLTSVHQFNHPSTLHSLHRPKPKQSWTAVQSYWENIGVRTSSHPVIVMVQSSTKVLSFQHPFHPVCCLSPLTHYPSHPPSPLIPQTCPYITVGHPWPENCLRDFCSRCTLSYVFPKCDRTFVSDCTITSTRHTVITGQSMYSYCQDKLNGISFVQYRYLQSASVWPEGIIAG